MADDFSGDLVARWRQGDQQAATELFHRYAKRLTALAGSRLPPQLNHRVDPEDVVQSVFRSFFVDARAGRFELQRGGDLWRLLAVITMQKLQHQLERHNADKRAVGREVSFGSEDSLLQMQDHIARHESPAEASALFDEVQEIMSRLDPGQRQILDLRLQGLNLYEIAAAVHCCERTVRRVLKQVKQQLEEWYAKNGS